MIFIQRVQPDSSNHPHTFPLHVSQSFSSEDGMVKGGRFEMRSKQGKTATGRAKTLHLSSLLVKSSYYCIISMRRRKEASGL